MGNKTYTDIFVAGKEITTTNKNKYYRYLVEGNSYAIFKKQTYYWDGAQYVATTGWFWGTNAGANNTGISCMGFGETSAQNNTGNYATFFGNISGTGNTGTSATGFGYSALNSNTGANTVGFGHNAGGLNAGANSVFVGHYSGYNNSGSDTTMVGYSSGYNNTSSQGVCIGANAGNASTESSPVHIGFSSGARSNSSYCVNLGAFAGYYNNWNQVTLLGAQSSPIFVEDSSTDKTFTDANVNATSKYITISSHGFASTGKKVNLRFIVVSGTAPSGLTTLTVYQFTVIDENTLYYSGISTTGSGSFKVIKDKDINNSTAIGYQSYPTKANQVILGNSSIVETVLRGNIDHNTDYHYEAATIGADTIGDSRKKWDSTNKVRFEEICTVANAVKGSGTWEKTVGKGYDSTTGERCQLVWVIADETISKGNVCSYIQGGTTRRVKKTPAAGNENDMPVGVAYTAAAGAGSGFWMAVSGLVQVLPETGVTLTQGYVLSTSGSVAGTVVASATAPATTTHFKEVGHCAETVAINTIGLCIIHFN